MENDFELHDSNATSAANANAKINSVVEAVTTLGVHVKVRFKEFPKLKKNILRHYVFYTNLI